MSKESRQVLLIDDEREKLESMVSQLRKRLDSATVRSWCPQEGENPSEVFQDLVGDETAIVVTDYDLTTGVKGLFGHTVVGWCRSRFVPVGDFSRGHRDALATEPDLFELRVPRDEREAIAHIVSMFNGFNRIREAIEQDPALLCSGSNPAQVLARLLDRENLESQLGPYLSKPGLFNSTLLDALAGGEHDDRDTSAEEKTRLLTYILGHVLVNAIMKYPGPILAEGPLCAYLSMSPEITDKLWVLFREAAYSGPFDGGERLFWRDDVDATVEHLAIEHNVDDSSLGSFGDYHRAVIEQALGGPLPTHGCTRCDGTKGGFWCPFTKRAVCERNDCSSSASSWVPAGAFACRVERSFFDEWSPILGL